MLVALLVAALVPAGIGLALRLYMGRDAEDALRPEERIAIADLRDPLPGNAFLICPPGYCTATAVPSPVFSLSTLCLAEAFSDVIAGESGIVWVVEDESRHPLAVIQHSLLLRFPDVITIEYVTLGPEQSSLAIYSRARYGRGDFGVNRKRVLRWLARLQQIVSPASAQ
jgi:hypothetical protein